VQEVHPGVDLVRRSEEHVTSGRLNLDDALKQQTEAQTRQAAEAAASAKAVAPSDAATPVAAAASAALIIGWSEARVKAWNGRAKNESAYYYRFNAPGEVQSHKEWSPEEHELFMDTLATCPGSRADYAWGAFSKRIPGRVGYQCSIYYRTLVKNGTVVDSNYVVDDQGRMQFKRRAMGGGGGDGGGGGSRVDYGGCGSGDGLAERVVKRGHLGDEALVPSNAPMRKKAKKEARTEDDNDKTGAVLPQPSVAPGHSRGGGGDCSGGGAVGVAGVHHGHTFSGGGDDSGIRGVGGGVGGGSRGGSGGGFGGSGGDMTRRLVWAKEMLLGGFINQDDYDRFKTDVMTCWAA
jgi:hypothetical protein